jgi:hypothetical protein
MWLDAMLSNGQLRGHGAKVGFFSHAHEGGGALDRGSPNDKSVHWRLVVRWRGTVSTLCSQEYIVQGLPTTLEC